MPRIFILADGSEGAPASTLRGRVQDAAPEASVHVIDGNTLSDEEIMVTVGDTLRRRSRSLTAPGSRPTALVGTSPEVRALAAKVESLTAGDAPVLITGETGTGKEHLARAIHDAGPRAGGPFVIVNCAALPENLLLAELFGHEAGAFTGAVRARSGRVEEADGGTLYLDAMDSLPPSVSAQLVELLASGSFAPYGGGAVKAVDVRVVCSMDRDEEDCIQVIQDRELALRLCGQRTRVPPLRERPEDVRVLANHLLADAARRTGRAAVLTDAALAALVAHDFPGNLRELENHLDRALLATDSEEVDAHHLPLSPPRPHAVDTTTICPYLEGAWTGIQRHSRELERSLLERVMRERPGTSLEGMATLLGTSARVLELRLREHGLGLP